MIDWIKQNIVGLLLGLILGYVIASFGQSSDQGLQCCEDLSVCRSMLTGGDQ